MNRMAGVWPTDTARAKLRGSHQGALPLRQGVARGASLLVRGVRAPRRRASSPSPQGFSGSGSATRRYSSTRWVGCVWSSIRALPVEPPAPPVCADAGPGRAWSQIQAVACWPRVRAAAWHTLCDTAALASLSSLTPHLPCHVASVREERAAAAVGRACAHVEVLCLW